jgi:hypothetical protein
VLQNNSRIKNERKKKFQAVFLYSCFLLMKFCSEVCSLELSDKGNSCQQYEGKNMYRMSYSSTGERREKRRRDKERKRARGARERNWKYMYSNRT